MELQNFDLLISMGADRRCEARVVRAPAGESNAWPLIWPFNENEDELFLREIYGDLLMRRVHASDESLVRSYGAQLFDACFCGPILELYTTSLAMMRDMGQGLRLRMLFDGDNTLHNAAWEFLYDSRRRHFIASKELSPIVRYLPMAQRIKEIAISGPLQILVAISAPVNESRLQVAHEWDILNEALARPVAAGLVSLTLLDGPCTIDQLRDTFRSQRVDVLHFIGHGEPGTLVLEDKQRRARRISVEHFCDLFPIEGPPSLIILNACAGAVARARDDPHSVTKGLIQEGAGAVIAMQAAITDEAALMFAYYFYRELAATGAVDRAITEARLRLRLNSGPVEWGTPVLYMRSPDGQLFRPEGGTAEPPKPEPLNRQNPRPPSPPPKPEQQDVAETLPPESPPRQDPDRSDGAGDEKTTDEYADERSNERAERHSWGGPPNLPPPDEEKPNVILALVLLCAFVLIVISIASFQSSSSRPAVEVGSEPRVVAPGGVAR